MLERAAVVVVTWNSADHIGRCLASVPGDTAVVVIDNASSDDTVAVATSVRPDADVVSETSNTGFATAVNRALERTVSYPFVLLLNPDARLDPHTLDRLLTFAEGHPRAGLVSALIVDETGRPERYAAGREPDIASVAVHELGLSRFLPARSLYAPGGRSHPEQRDWVAATAVLVRQETVQDVGPLDTTFFLYGEDVDWCRRVRERGWQVWIEPRARVVHRKAASASRAGPWIVGHRVGALDRYYRSRHRGWRLVAFRLLRVLGPLLRTVVLGVAGALPGRRDLWVRGRRAAEDAGAALRLLRGAT